MFDAGRELLSLVGDLWIAAWVAGFVVMTLESSRPKPEVGSTEHPSAWARVGAIAIAALPFLLFLDAFGAFILANQNSGALGGREMLPIVVLVAVIGVLVLVPAIVGSLIARVSPQFGARLHRLAHVLGLVVLAFALYVTGSHVLTVLNLYVLSRVG